MSDGYAGNAIHQNWVDVGAGLDPGASWTETFRWRIPEVSKMHTTVRCRIYGNSASTTGQVRFKSVTGADTQAMTLTGAADAWFQTAADLTVDASAGYDEVYFEVYDDVDIRAVAVDYVQNDPSGNWPTTDGALAAGVLAGDTQIPMDDQDVQADAPLSSDLATIARTNLDQIYTRQRVYMNVSGTDAAHAGFDGNLTYGVVRRLWIPVWPGARRDGRELTLHARGGGGTVYIQHGAGGFQLMHPGNPDAETPGTPIADASTVHSLATPGGGGWATDTIPMREVLTGHEPVNGYAGLVPLFVRVVGDVQTVSIWGP